MKKLQDKIKIPEGCQLTSKGFIVSAKGPKGTNDRAALSSYLTLTVQGQEAVIMSESGNKKAKREIYTASAHIRNLLRGVKEGYEYKLKICQGHFPVTVKATKDEFSIKNFLGEKVPRVMSVAPGVDIKVEGQNIKVSGIDIEKTGMTAAQLEHLTFISKRDRRIFQDGIYIIEKPERR
jgi:large subunit ribosomal protein L6